MVNKNSFSGFEIVILLIIAFQGATCAMLVNYKLYADAILIAIICAYIVWAVRYKVTGYKIKKWLGYSIIIVLGLCQIFNIVSVRYWLLAILVVACNVYAIAIVHSIADNQTRFIWRNGWGFKLKRWIVSFCAGFVIISMAIFTSCVAISELIPDVVIHIFDTKPIPVLNEEIKLDNGTLLIKDIKYSDKYDNSYMDIYISPKANKNSPTFFYVHGGAYAIGDKTGQGFDATSHYVIENYFNYYIERGYNLVSINYAMSPKNKYPTQINQVVEAVDYTIKNCDYINMDDVVFGGESAGGNLIGQFINIQTNEEYANLLGIQPVIDKEKIRGVVFISALLDNERFDNTGNIFIDYAFNLFGRAYFDVWALENNEQIQETNVISYVTENFPPAYISDGNCRSFSKQAIDLSKKLNELGVENKFNYYEKDVAKLGHMYEYEYNEHSIENVTNTFNFLESLKVTK